MKLQTPPPTGNVELDIWLQRLMEEFAPGSIDIDVDDFDGMDSVTITGGTIDGTPIGSTTPSTGVFTTALADVLKTYDTDDSNTLQLKWNEDSAADRVLNLILNSGDRILDLAENLKVLDGQDIELHGSGGEKAQLAIDTQNAERTLNLSGNLTVESASVLNQDLTTDADVTFNDLTISTPSSIYALSHDSFANFVANEHIDHTGVTLTAGDGLSGGGDISANRTFAVSVDDSTIEINTDTLRVKDAGITYAKIQNVSATDKLLGRSSAGAGVVEEIACTAFARSILDDADEATFKATVNLEPGTDVLAYDAGLQDLAGVAMAANKMYYTTADNTHAAADLTAAGMAMNAAANAAAQLALLSGHAGATFDLNDQQLSNIKSLAFNDGGAVITEVKDEDNMASDSDTVLATQQSIKAYVDNVVAGASFAQAAVLGTL